MPNENKTFSLEELEAAKQEAAKAAVAREKANREKFVSKEEATKQVEEAKAEAIASYKKEAEQYKSAYNSFKSAGGNKEAFDDFYEANKKEIDFENESTLEKSMNKFKESKKYLFNGSIEPKEKPEGDKGSADDEYYPGTLQKINK